MNTVRVMIMYPTLAFCAEEIFYDNGMCNRCAPPVEAQIVSALARCEEKFGDVRMQYVEVWLANYHKDDLTELCTNGPTWRQSHPSMSVDVELILDEIFEKS